MSNGKPWTVEHHKLMLRLHSAGCSDHVIAGATDHDVDTVGRHRRAWGLNANHRTAYSTLEAIPPSTWAKIEAECARVAA
jgi:hypothetical protein